MMLIFEPSMTASLFFKEYAESTAALAICLSDSTRRVCVHLRLNDPKNAEILLRFYLNCFSFKNKSQDPCN